MACISGNGDNATKSSLCCWSCRCTVAILSCLSLMNMYAQQLAMTVSLGCMLNSSLIVRNVLSLDGSVDPDGCERSGLFQEAAQHNQSLSKTRLVHPSFKISGSIAWERNSQSLILGAFMWGYLFSVGLGGLFAFKSSAHKLLGYSHLAMSLATLMTPIASMYMHVYSVVGLQFMSGLGAGTTYPAIMSLWQRWAPPNERARLFAVTFSGIPLGMLIATSSIQVTCYHTQGRGWSALFYSLGLFGFLWFILWMTLVSSSPDKHSRISEIERQYISKTLSCHESLFDQTDIPWKNVFLSRLLWSVVPVHFSADWGLYLLSYAIPVYLRDVKYTDINRFSNGYFSTAPFALFLVVLLAFGALADCMMKCCSCRVETVRKIYACAGTFAFSSGMVVLTFVRCDDWENLVIALTSATGLHGLQYCSSLIAPMDKCPRYATVIMMFSQIVTQLLKIVGIYVSNYLLREGGRYEWHAVLYVSAAVTAASGAVFLLFGVGKLKIIKSDNISLAFTKDELSSANAEAESSRSAEGSGTCNHQASSLSRPFMIDQDIQRLDSVSASLQDGAAARKSIGREAEASLLSNRGVVVERQRKVPLVSIV